MIEESVISAARPARGLIIMRLSASRLTVERGGRIVFSNLSFALDAGRSLTVTGPNGAGKSTLLRALAGLLPLSGGTISLVRPYPARHSPNRRITSATPMPSKVFSPSPRIWRF